MAVAAKVAGARAAAARAGVGGRRRQLRKRTGPASRPACGPEEGEAAGLGRDGGAHGRGREVAEAAAEEEARRRWWRRLSRAREQGSCLLPQKMWAPGRQSGGVRRRRRCPWTWRRGGGSCAGGWGAAAVVATAITGREVAFSPKDVGPEEGEAAGLGGGGGAHGRGGEAAGAGAEMEARRRRWRRLASKSARCYNSLGRQLKNAVLAHTLHA